MNSVYAEQHLCVDWTCHYDEVTLRQRFVTKGLHVTTVFRCDPLSAPLATMARFYGLQPTQWDTSDVRGTVPFRLFLLTDPTPRYLPRPTTKGTRYVNVNLFDIKAEVRRQGLSEHPIHATDNIQETKDNLAALGLVETHYRRRTFDSLADVFHTLNAVHGLQWLVLRNFEDMPDHALRDDHQDIDLLVSDFYATKAALDADAAVDSHRLEDGGYRVLQTVMVGGVPTLFDFRHVGDQYYDRAFQVDMLQQRRRYQMFYVPTRENHLFSLLYHGLIHKRTLSPTYERVFRRYGLSLDRGWLRELLDGFMHTRGYTYVRPEPSVGYFA